MSPASKPKRLSQFWHPIASVEEVTEQWSGEEPEDQRRGGDAQLGA